MLYINTIQHITYAYLTITFAVSSPAEPSLPAAARPLHLSQSGGSYASHRRRAIDECYHTCDHWLIDGCEFLCWLAVVVIPLAVLHIPSFCKDDPGTSALAVASPGTWQQRRNARDRDVGDK
jgi:hypothetical protein